MSNQQQLILGYQLVHIYMDNQQCHIYVTHDSKHVNSYFHVLILFIVKYVDMLIGMTLIVLCVYKFTIKLTRSKRFDPKFLDLSQYN